MSRKAMPPPTPTAQPRIWEIVCLPVIFRQPRAVGTPLLPLTSQNTKAPPPLPTGIGVVPGVH
ncbi:MAG: hypothetical protein G01um101416_281 [Microgenomates group bacterium Gr01-1014_16]|nr:MAG: hypothetical protein G01um101416_281 [Microgenomates group bacterium Gr01-1014_16]